jgi:hypothetical protein
MLQGLPEDKKAELRATIAALEAEAAANKQKEKERTYSTKYHKVTMSKSCSLPLEARLNKTNSK